MSAKELRECLLGTVVAVAREQLAVIFHLLHIIRRCDPKPDINLAVAIKPEQNRIKMGERDAISF